MRCDNDVISVQRVSSVFSCRVSLIVRYLCKWMSGVHVLVTEKRRPATSSPSQSVVAGVLCILSHQLCFAADQSCHFFLLLINCHFAVFLNPNHLTANTRSNYCSTTGFRSTDLANKLLSFKRSSDTMNSRDLNGYGRMSSSDSSSGSNGYSVDNRSITLSPIRVEVTEPMTHVNSKHVLYQMEITCPEKTWHTMKRYSEFYKLYEQVNPNTNLLFFASVYSNVP